MKFSLSNFLKRNSLMVLGAFLLALPVAAQSGKVFSNELVEQKAEYPGGEAAILRFIAENLVYPEKAVDENVQGVVRLHFRVEMDGSVGQVIVMQGLSPECDQASIAVVKKLKRFTPARQQGRPVPVWFALPIRFRLPDPSPEE